MLESSSRVLKYVFSRSLVDSIISGAIVALLGIMGLALLNFVTGGSVIAAMGGITFVMEPINFSTAIAEEIEVPNSKKARFCALTSVSIPAGGGKCHVRYNGKNWVYFNNRGSDCYMACVY